MLSTDEPCSIPKTVIFFPTKREAVEGFLFLQRSAAHKHYVGAYHASLTKETKFSVRQNFSSRTTEMRCLCATVAFGMVRCVIVFVFFHLITIFVVGYGYTRHSISNYLFCSQFHFVVVSGKRAYIH